MTDALPIPNLTLSDGKTIPQLGFGVFLVEPDEAERVGRALINAAGDWRMHAKAR